MKACRPASLNCLSVLVHFGAMKKLIFLLAVCLSLLLYGPLHAESLNLYQAEVPVQDDSAAERSRGLSEALQRVLVRLSGNPRVSGHPGAAQVLGKAGSLVQQYRYRVASEPAEQRYLWASFDSGAVDRLVRQAGIPLWSSQRPRVLVWIATESGGRRQLLNFESDAEASQALTDAAQRRGMPLQLPLLDLQDQAALSVADVWADYETAIRAASERYPHDVILSGRVRRLSGNSWRAEWSLWERDRQQSFDSGSLPFAAALQSGIDSAQDRLAARYVPALDGDGPESVRMAVVGIHSLQDYGAVMRLLGAQEPIHRLSFHEVRGDRLVIDVWVDGGATTLANNLVLGGELLQIDNQWSEFAIPGTAPAPSAVPVGTAPRVQAPGNPGQAQGAGLQQAQETEPEQVDLSFAYQSASG